jgi:hypothetical protein
MMRPFVYPLTQPSPPKHKFTTRQFCSFSLKSSPPSPLSISWQRGNQEGKDGVLQEVSSLEKLKGEGLRQFISRRLVPQAVRDRPEC